jgi:hypothetical protein
MNAEKGSSALELMLVLPPLFLLLTSGFSIAETRLREGQLNSAVRTAAFYPDSHLFSVSKSDLAKRISKKLKVDLCREMLANCSSEQGIFVRTSVVRISVDEYTGRHNLNLTIESEFEIGFPTPVTTITRSHEDYIQDSLFKLSSTIPSPYARPTGAVAGDFDIPFLRYSYLLYVEAQVKPKLLQNLALSQTKVLHSKLLVKLRKDFLNESDHTFDGDTW